MEEPHTNSGFNQALNNLGPVLRDARTKIRAEVLENLLQGITNSDDSQCASIIQTILSCIPYLSITASSSIISLFSAALRKSERLLTPTLTILSKECDKTKSGSISPSHRFTLLSLLNVIVTIDQSEPTICMLGQAYYSVICYIERDQTKQTATRQLRRAVRGNAQAVIPRILQVCCESKDEIMSPLLGLAIDVSLRLKVTPDIETCGLSLLSRWKDQIIAHYVKAHVMAAQPTKKQTYQAFKSFFSNKELFNDADLANFLEVVAKPVLRSPELVLGPMALVVLASDVGDQHVSKILAVVISNVKSSNSVIRSGATSLFEAMKVTDKAQATAIISDLSKALDQSLTSPHTRESIYLLLASLDPNQAAVHACLPHLARESDLQALIPAITSALGQHLASCSESLPRNFIEALSSPKENLRYSAWSILSISMNRTSAHFEGLESPIVNALRSATSQMSNSGCSLIEGYVAIAHCIGSTSYLSKFRTEVTRCVQTTDDPKSNFLFTPRVYNKISNGNEEEAILRAISSVLTGSKAVTFSIDSFAVAQCLVSIYIRTNRHETRVEIEGIAATSPGLLWDGFLRVETKIPSLILPSSLRASASQESRNDAILESLIPLHETGSERLWVDAANRMGVDLVAFVEGNWEKIRDELNKSSGDSFYSAVKTLSYVSPELVTCSLVEQCMQELDISKFSAIGDRELQIWTADPKGPPVTDPLKSVATPTMGSEKMEQWEKDLRAELAAKKKAGQTQLSPAEKKAISAQLTIEANIRSKVETLRLQRIKSFRLLCLLSEAQTEIFSQFLGPAMKLILLGGKKPFCALTGQETIQTVIILAKQCEPRVKSHQLPLALAVLRSNKTERLEKELRTETIQSLVSRMLFRIKLLSEEQPLNLFTFSFIMPLLDKVLQEGGVGLSKVNDGEDTREEQVQLAADILASHCAIASNKLYPRRFMISSLILLASRYSKLSKSSTTALITLGESMKDNADTVEINTLLKGSLSNQSHTRSACFQAMQPLDLTDYDWFPELWIGVHDEDEPNARNALRVWDENGFEVPEDFCSHLIPYMAHINGYVRRSTSVSLAKACQEYQGSVIALVKTLKSNYSAASQPLKQVLDSYGLPLLNTEAMDSWPERHSIAMTLKELISYLPTKMAPSLLDFLVKEGLRDSNALVRAEVLQAGEKLIDDFGRELLAELVPKFDSYMAMNGNSRAGADDHVAEAVIVLFGRLGQFFKPDDPRIANTVSKLTEALGIPSEPVQVAVAECLSPLVIMLSNEDRGALISGLLKNLVEGEKYSSRRGAAFGLAGTIKGLGISALKDFDILRSIKHAAADSKKSQARQGALFAFETLSLMLGPLFEPYVIQQIPLLLNSFGDGVADVREATTDAARVIMRTISGYCVKVIMPSLLEGLDERQWRTKKGSIELLGSMAFCAPEQLSVALPTIIPRLTDVLMDSHTQVRQAANSSLKHFGEVINNPEIKELVPVLLKALVDPTTKNTSALSALLKTTFTHYIDSPSLALVVPILERGLRDTASEDKRKAVQIVGNMASITDTKDFVPYLGRLVPHVMTVLVDPVPDTRGTAAKALGTLVERLGEDTFPVLITDLLQMLKSETSGVDRQGAAQGLSEVLAGLGLDRLEDLLPEIISNSTSIKPFVREGFISLLIYLPSTFGSRFSPHLGKTIPPILGGLADDSEYVREASMRASRMIILNYSNKALDLLLPELEEGLQNENWRIRHSSIQLTGDMLFRVAGISGKIETQEENEEDEYSVSADNARKKLLEVLGRDRRDKVLASVYLLRQDVSNAVRVGSLQVWKALVVNTPRTVREILSHIIEQTVHLLGSDAEDLHEAASRTLSDLCKKLGDKVLGDIFDQLLQLSVSDNAQSREGVCIAFVQVLRSVSEEDLENHTKSIIDCVRTGLVDESAKVRSAAAEAFDAMQSCMGPKAIDGVIPTLLEALRSPGVHSDAALKALKEVMAIRSSVVFPVLVPSLINQPISAFSAHALSTLIKVSGPALTPRVVKILHELYSALQVTKDVKVIQNINEANVACMSALQEDGLHVLMMMLIEWVKHASPERRVAGLQLFALFCTHSKLYIEMYRIDWIRQLISLLDDREESVSDASWQALEAFLQTIPKEHNEGLAIPLCNAFEGTGSPGRYVPGISKQGRLNPIVTVALQSLLAGTNDQRAFSATLIRYLVSRTSPEALKPYTIQLVGPLIRVLGEKFPVTVKISIVEALTAFLNEVAAFIKPFLPQLQRSFMKAIIDPSSSVLRRRSGEALGALMVTQPRADPVANELHNIIMSDDYDLSVQADAMAGLTLVLASAKTNITEPVREKISSSLIEVISSSKVKETAFSTVGDLVVGLAKIGDQTKLLTFVLEGCQFSPLAAECVSAISKELPSSRTLAIERLLGWKREANESPLVMRMIRDAEKLKQKEG